MTKLKGGTLRRTEEVKRSWPPSEREARAGTLAATKQSRFPEFVRRADLLHDLAGFSLHMMGKSALPSNLGERD